MPITRTLSGYRNALAILAAGTLMPSGCSGLGAVSPASAGGRLLPATTAGRTASSTKSDVIAPVPALQSLGIRDLGAARGDISLPVVLTLRYRNEAKLDQLIAEQVDRGSAHYHRWLTNAQFNASFAPSEAEYRRVVRSLQQAGFQIEKTYTNRTVVDATGSIATIERYFGTSIHRVAQRHDGQLYVNVQPAHAPADLRGLLLSLDGLTTVVVMETDHAVVRVRRSGRVRHPSVASAACGRAPCLYGPESSVTLLRGYGPLAFSAGYDLPVEHTSRSGKPYDGLGRASGIVIDGDVSENDLSNYLYYFGISRDGPATTRVPVDGRPGGDSVEATLDAETIVSNAPGTALYMYEIPSLSDPYITDAYNTVVSDNTVDTVNSSFGGCEAFQWQSARAWDEIAKQGAAKGITFHASTGDKGGTLCTQAPASSPSFVAVGGTALIAERIGRRIAWAEESAWSGGGGGISALFALPNWQKGVPGTIRGGRNMPDVAFDADPYTGAAFYMNATWDSADNPVGGTSLSSPIFDAAITELCQMKNGRIGLTAQQLFDAWRSSGYGSKRNLYFHDIVQGTNGAFWAAPGYDLTSGIGSIDFWNLANLL